MNLLYSHTACNEQFKLYIILPMCLIQKQDQIINKIDYFLTYYVQHTYLNKTALSLWHC